MPEGEIGNGKVAFVLLMAYHPLILFESAQEPFRCHLWENDPVLVYVNVSSLAHYSIEWWFCVAFIFEAYNEEVQSGIVDKIYMYIIHVLMLHV